MVSKHQRALTGHECQSRSCNVLWWSSGDRTYSRDRVVRQSLQSIGCNLIDYSPLTSRWGHLEARFRSIPRPDLVWIPCFRQRDAEAAIAFAAARGIPVVFDPLISSYDKVVFERQKSDPDSLESRRLLRWESGLFNSATVLVADTAEHAAFFADCHQVREESIVVVPVSAEEQLFQAQPFPARTNGRVTAFFYGSFIGLQGTEIIAAAARFAPEVDWVMLGDGPARKSCEAVALGASNLRLLEPVPYETLPEAIGRAEILLGVFGTSDKAARVIPNKVYQSMACGRCVITRESTAYPEKVTNSASDATGLIFVPPGDPAALSSAVTQLAADRNRYVALGREARRTFDTYFGKSAVDDALTTVLNRALGVSQARRAA